MGIIAWLVLGGLAGWLASKVTGNDAGMGIGANIIVGIIGAFLGGFIANNLFGIAGVTEFDIRSFLVAFGGAIVLLLIVNAVTGRGRTRR